MEGQAARLLCQAGRTVSEVRHSPCPLGNVSSSRATSETWQGMIKKYSNFKTILT